MFAESDIVELKSEIVSDICKEVIAFANTKGGTLYIGIAGITAVCVLQALPNRTERMRIFILADHLVCAHLFKLSSFRFSISPSDFPFSTFSAI